MKLSVNFFDALFGEKVIVEVPGPNGQILKKKVTKKWLEKMWSEGKFKRIEEPIVRVHMLSPFGCTVQNWIIGKDIDQATVDQFRDIESGDLYAMTHFEKGESRVSVLKKQIWEDTRQFVDSRSR